MKNRGRPQIAVTGPDTGGWPTWLLMRIAIARAGGRAVRIVPSESYELVNFDGLILGSGAVGVRLPAYPLLRRLLVRVGPLTGTSANRSGQTALCTADEVSAILRDDIQMILDAGSTPGGMPSTILDARTPVRMIREGAISRAAVASVLHRAGYELSP